MKQYLILIGVVFSLNLILASNLELDLDLDLNGKLT
jgi:hypothetical protein